MSGNNGEKKPLPKLTEKDKDAFIAVLLYSLGKLTGKEPIVGIKQEALDNYPETEGPVFTWDNSKKQWFVSLPKSEKKKIVTPNKRIIGV